MGFCLWVGWGVGVFGCGWVEWVWVCLVVGVGVSIFGMWVCLVVGVGVGGCRC